MYLKISHGSSGSYLLKNLINNQSLTVFHLSTKDLQDTMMKMK